MQKNKSNSKINNSIDSQPFSNTFMTATNQILHKNTSSV